MIVDSFRQTWPIDFYKTTWFHGFRDFANLEATIIIEMISSEHFAALLEFCEDITTVPKLTSRIKFRDTYKLPELQKALGAIRQIRRETVKHFNNHPTSEYLVPLGLFAISYLKYDGISEATAKKALLLAMKCAEGLKKLF